MENYYKATPLVGPTNGYNDGEVKQFSGKMSVLSSQGETNVEGDCDMKGIKEENSMEGYLAKNNPAY